MDTNEKQFFNLFGFVSKAINSSLNLQEVLELITENFTKALDVKACAVFLFDKESDRLEISTSYGLSESYLQKGPVVAEKSISETLNGKAVFINDATKDDRIQYPDAAKKEGIVSILSVPVSVKKKVIGELRIYTSHPRKFSDNEIRFISRLGEMGGTTIENARYWKSFRNVCKTINSSLRLQQVLDILTEQITKAANVKACAIYLLNRINNRLEISASYGLSEAHLKKGPLDAKKSIGETFSGKIVSIDDVTKDPRVQYPNDAKKEGIVSVLSVPVSVKEKIIGVLRVYTSHLHKFSNNEIDFISGFAEMGGIAIENARMYDKLKLDHEGLINDVHKWFEFGRMP